MISDLPAKPVKKSVGDYLAQSANRRVVLRASGMIAGLTAIGGLPNSISENRALALAPPETLSADWTEADRIAETTTSEVGDERFFQTEFPLTAIAASWDNAVGSWPVVQVRLSEDGVNFTDPVVLVAHDDGGPPSRDHRWFTTLLYHGSATWVGYRITDEQGQPSAVPGFTFNYLNTNDGPSLETIPTVGVATDDPTAPPVVISRADWGADESHRFEGNEEVWPPSWRTVEHVIIHHTATANVQDPVAAVRAIFYYHAVTRGWGDIGYNYLVDRNGNIYEGRIGGQNVVGGHAFQYAWGSSGVGVIGNFSFKEVSESAKASTVALIAWLARDLDPQGTSDFHEQDDLPTICSHRDVLDTECPGDFLYDELESIRDLVALAVEPPAEGPPAGLVPGDIVEAGASGTRLRRSASPSGTLIADLSAGTVGIILEGPEAASGYQWYRLTTDYGIGWAAAEFLDIAPSGAELSGRYESGDVVEVSDQARLREEPGIDADIVKSLSTGTVAVISEGPFNAGEYRWYRMYTAEDWGWFASLYLEPSNATAPEMPPEPIPEDMAIGDTIEVSTDDGGGLNLRSSPGTGASVIKVLSNGSIGEIIDGPDAAGGLQWFKLEISNATGWAAAKYLKPSDSIDPGEAFSEGDQVVVDTGNGGLNLRSAASTAGGVITVLANGTSGTILDGPIPSSGYNFYRVQMGAKTGWAAGEFLSLGSGFSVGDAIVVVTDDGGNLNLRQQASTTATILASMLDGTAGEIIDGPQSANGYTWYRIDTDYGNGWAAGEFLQPS